MFSFSCLEQPSKCFLNSSYYDKRLGSTGKGVFLTDNHLDWEQWEICPVLNTNSFLIRNSSHGCYLTSDSSGIVSVISSQNHDEAKWLISLTSSGRRMITSVTHERRLCYNGGEHVYTVDVANDKEEQIVWNFEFETGELCFISSTAKNMRLKCNPNGVLSMTDNWLGWEVWRFIEVGEGFVLISSWTHKTKFLCSDPQGHVFTTENRLGEREKWSVEKDNVSNDGIKIRSKCHNRVLQFHENKILTTEENKCARNCLWRTETACLQKYFISSTSHDKRVGANHDSLFTTKNRRAWEEWKIEENDELGYFTFYSLAHAKFLGSTKEGEVFLTDKALEWEKWEIEHSPYNGYFLISKEHRRQLSCDNHGNLCTTNGSGGEWEDFHLEPRMPSTITGKQIKSYTVLGITGIASLGLAIAMPFIGIAVISSLGFTEGGIAAGSIAAGMMSAEAIAAGGGVVAGGTVAALQSIGAAGFGIAGTCAAVSTGAGMGGLVFGGVFASSYKSMQSSFHHVSPESSMKQNMYRPFADWKKW